MALALLPVSDWDSLPVRLIHPRKDDDNWVVLRLVLSQSNALMLSSALARAFAGSVMYFACTCLW